MGRGGVVEWMSRRLRVRPSVELVVRKTKSSVVWNPVDGGEQNAVILYSS